MIAALIEELRKGAESGDSDRSTSDLMRRAADLLAALAQAPAASLTCATCQTPEGIAHEVGQLIERVMHAKADGLSFALTDEALVVLVRRAVERLVTQVIERERAPVGPGLPASSASDKK